MEIVFKQRLSSYLTGVAILFSGISSANLLAATAPPLGTAQTFAVLGASAVTNTGPTVIMGDLGVSPGSAVTGFPPGIVTMGTIHAMDAVATQARVDAMTAYNALAGQACNTNLTGQNLGGLTLIPGVYCFATSAQLTGTLTLDAQGNPNAVFVFQTGSTLTTASSSSVVVINGGIACNVFFQVGSSATLGTGTQLMGSILANTSITLTTNATVSGRVLALNGAVTLDTNQVSVCSPAPVTGTLQVCKVAGPGIVAGTLFAFNVAGTPITVAAGPSPNGTCSAVLVEPAGTVGIAETIPPGVALTSVTTTPPGALVSSNLATGTANVTVTMGALTVVTFTDALLPNTGFIQVCKVAGPGIVTGTLFAFNVGGTPLTVAAGPAPNGTCSAPLVEPSGNVGIAETIPPGVALTSVTTTPPGALVSSNLAAGTATVTVTTGATTIVTFTDALLPNTGFIQVCKVAGPGVVTGTLFAFNVAGTPVNVAAGPPPNGTCSAPLVEPSGSVGITEILLPGIALTSVTTTPPGALVSSNLAGGMATVTVTTGATTIVTFTDALIVVAPAVLDAFQVRYAVHLDIGDSFVNVTNTGASSTVSFPTQNGSICVNVYTFSPDEQLVSCCTCPVTPNGLASLSARNDLIGNTLTPGVPTSIVIKLLASAGGGAGAPSGCNAGTVGVNGANLPVAGLSAWGTTIHSLPVTPGTPAITYGETETPFTKATLSVPELQRIVTLCAFIQTNGSGFGICRACRLGGLGGVKQE